MAGGAWSVQIQHERATFSWQFSEWLDLLRRPGQFRSTTIAFHQARWASVTDDELRRLVEQGIDAPIRVTGHQEKR